jgi:putative transport protein
MVAVLTQFLADNPIVTLFGVIGIGYLLGEIRFFGFRVGVAGILFAGLAVGAVLGPAVALPPMVSTFGLILFIYTASAFSLALASSAPSAVKATATAYSASRCS